MRPGEGDAIPRCEIDHICSGQVVVGRVANHCCLFDAVGGWMIRRGEAVGTQRIGPGVILWRFGPTEVVLLLQGLAR